MILSALKPTKLSCYPKKYTSPLTCTPKKTTLSLTGEIPSILLLSTVADATYKRIQRKATKFI